MVFLGHRVWDFFRRYRRRWAEHGITDSAASLSFYALISLIPLLYIGVLTAGVFLGTPAAQGELEKQLTEVMGADAAVIVHEMLRELGEMPKANTPAFIGILVTLLYAGSHVLTKLRITLNTINGVDAHDPSRRVFSRLFARGLSSLLILVFGGLLVVGTIADGIFGRFTEEWDSPLFARWQVLQGYDTISGAVLLILAYGLILKILPRRRPLWRHVWLGALLSGLLVTSLKWVLGTYLQHSPLASVLGTGLTTLLFLFWIFLSFQALLAGAELAAMLGRVGEESTDR